MIPVCKTPIERREFILRKKAKHESNLVNSWTTLRASCLHRSRSITAEPVRRKCDAGMQGPGHRIFWIGIDISECDAREWSFMCNPWR
jgi:hypothetical protein